MRDENQDLKEKKMRIGKRLDCKSLNFLK